MKSWYRPERLVIAGAGIEHENLVYLAGSHFARLIGASGCENSEAIRNLYHGGYHFIPTTTDSELSHIYMGFKGLRIVDPDIYTLAVMQYLLGGGGSFSAGGPGKGMYSRFYTNVLNRHPEIDHCSSFHHIYSDTSLFGIAASFHHKAGNRGKIIEPGWVLPHLLRELRLLLYSPVPMQELERAKNQLKSSLVMALESQATDVEDLGRQILVHGHRIPVMEMCKQVEKVSVQDITRVSHLIFGNNCKDPASLILQAPVGLDDYNQVLEGQGISGV